MRGVAMADLLMRGVDDSIVQALKKRAGAAALLSPPRRNLAELLAAMPDVGVDADFQRQPDPGVAADVFD
jgi:hypothetical protein